MKNSKEILFGILIVFALGLFAGTALGRTSFQNKNKISTEEAKQKIENFFANAGVTEVTVKSVEENENNIYKVVVASQGQEYDSYITRNGKIFFYSGVNLEEFEKLLTESKAKENTSTETPKSDKPAIELFVMSHCPYGTQMEKGLFPVLNTLGDKVDFKLKFVSYAMHGEKEITEEKRQYCIAENYNDKLLPYLGCFLEDETKSSECLVSVGLNEWEVNNCMQQVDTQFGITASFNDQSSWIGEYPPFNTHLEDNQKYNIAGSPALVINETMVAVNRDPQSLLTAVCNAFNEKPEECNIPLSAEVPSAGFGNAAANVAGASTSENATCN